MFDFADHVRYISMLVKLRNKIRQLSLLLMSVCMNRNSKLTASPRSRAWRADSWYIGLFLIPFAAMTSSSQTWKVHLAQADSLAARSRPDSAIVLGQMALGELTCEKGEKDTAVAGVLEKLGMYCDGTFPNEGNAQSYYRRSLAIREELLPPLHPDNLRIIQRLANSLDDVNQFLEKERLQKRSLSMAQSVYGEASMAVSGRLNNLALLYMTWGRLDEAEDLMNRAIAIDHVCLQHVSPNQNLGLLYWKQGRLREAERLFKTIIDSMGDTYGGMYNNLGIVYQEEGDYARAELMYRQAIRLKEMRNGVDNPFEATSLNNLGELLRVMGRSADAESTHVRALSIRIKTGGYRSGSVGSSLCKLGDVLTDEGKFGRAESCYVAALDIQRSSFGESHEKTAETIESLSRLYCITSRPQKGLELADRALQMRTDIQGHSFMVMSEHDARGYVRTVQRTVDNYLTCFFEARTDNDSLARDALRVVSGWKGQTAESAVDLRKVVTAHSNLQLTALFREYQGVLFQLSRVYSRDVGTDDKSRQHTVDSLDAAANALENQLARQSRPFRVRCAAVGLAMQDRDILPAHSTLIEYYKFNYLGRFPWDAIPHYLAALVSSQDRTVVVDLGDASGIDSLICLYRSHLARIAMLKRPITESEQLEYDSITAGLSKLIWAPLAEHISHDNSLFIAPDGGLNLVSFAGLTLPDSRFLIEEHPIHYLSAGRDLLRLQERDSSGTGLIAFGDPDFDAPVAARMGRYPATPLSVAAQSVSHELHNVRSGCGVLSEMNLPPLHGTRTEAQSIARQWKKRYQHQPAMVFVGPGASEDRFKKESVGKKVIHLATHGYFLEGACIGDGDTTGPAVSPGQAYSEENPLLQSGMFLAGANLHGKGADEAHAEDGIVTALEVSAMDLRGTDLVVLSACETGLGRVEQGEGVYGLRRAFQMAGARTVVSALWQVPDEDAMEFMKALYANMSLSANQRQAERPSLNETSGSRSLSRGITYPELMQKVALQCIRELRLRHRPTHPFSWGAFVATGDWEMQ